MEATIGPLNKGSIRFSRGLHSYIAYRTGQVWYVTLEGDTTGQMFWVLSDDVIDKISKAGT